MWGYTQSEKVLIREFHQETLSINIDNHTIHLLRTGLNTHINGFSEPTYRIATKRKGVALD